MSRPISSDHPLIVYGAGGVTGRLIVEAAVAEGVPVLLAGRSEASLGPIAARHGLPVATADATDAAGLRALASRGAVLLNAAGPFAVTGLALAQAALAGGAAYVDVGGEVDVLAAQAKLDAQALAAGLPLVCAAGYGVAAGEGLALHVAGRLPAPTRLRLGLDTYVGRRSAGAAQSTVAALRRGNYRIVAGAMRPAGFADGPWRIDLDGERYLFAGAPLAEAWAAARSSGVAEVRAGIRTKPHIVPVLRLAAAAASFGPVGRFMARRAAAGGAEVAEGEAPGRRSTLIAEAWNANGERAASALLIRREGYQVAAELAVAAAIRAVQPGLSGFHTPGSAFGPDFVLGVEGVERRDLA